MSQQGNSSPLLHGNYTFTSLGPGTYSVREVAPAGWTETTPPGNAYRVTMTSGLTATGDNFGDFKLRTISGTGTLAAGDPGLTVQPANLNANGNGVLDPGEVSTVTAANGMYTFTGLGPGNYQVAEVAPSGWTRRLPRAMSTGSP